MARDLRSSYHVLSMIRVAEARGACRNLRMMGSHYESRPAPDSPGPVGHDLSRHRADMAGGVIALLTLFILPMFASMLKDIDRKAQLPLPSRVLIGLSNFVGWIGWWLIP